MKKKKIETCVAHSEKQINLPFVRVCPAHIKFLVDMNNYFKMSNWPELIMGIKIVRISLAIIVKYFSLEKRIPAETESLFEDSCTCLTRGKFFFIQQIVRVILYSWDALDDSL